jgi:hypothetical protein
MSDAERIQNLEKQLADIQAQNRALEQQLSSFSHAKQPEPKPRHFNWRKYSSRLLLILGLIALIPASMLVWLNRTIMDPNGYIKTVGPVIQQPAVQKAITIKASTALFANVNVEQEVAQALPPQALFLAPPITSQIQSQTTNLIGKVVAGPKFYNIWIKTNQKAQATFVQVAKANRTSPVVDVNDVYAFISSQLQDTKLAPLLNKQLPAKIGTIQIANVPALVTIPHLVSQLNTWRFVMLLLALVFLGSAVWLNRDHRRGLMNVGGVFIGSAIVAWVLVRIARSLMLGKIADQVNKDAAQAIWSTVLHYFYVELSVIATLGLVIIAVGWVLGSSRWALRIRAGSGEGLSRARTSWLPSLNENPAIMFMQKNRRYFEWGILGLTILALLASIPLTIGTIALIVIIAFVALLGVEFFAYPLVQSP